LSYARMFIILLYSENKIPDDLKKFNFLRN